MAITVKHKFVSAIPDAGDTTIVQPSNWNDDHQLSGTVPPTNGGTGASTLTGYVKGNGTSTMTANATIPNTDITGLGTASTKDAGVANGVATLDNSGTVPISQLPAAVIGALSYQGTWNASTNTPTLTSSVGTKGYYYVVNVAGSTNLNGITDWQVGDWAVYNGSAWQKIDNTDAVTSVNGYTGTVNLTYTDVGAFPATSTTGSGNVVLATGATQAHPTISDYEIFTSTTPPSYQEGRVWFDSVNHTLAQFNDVTNNTVHLGEEIQLKVINNTGSTINIGQPVYITGTSSGQTYPNVALAIANTLTTSNVIGLANQAISSGNAGYVTTIGLIQGINTGSYTVGDTLYLSPYSAGFYQNTIPPTGYAVKLGTVAYVNSSAGAIYINKSNLSVQAGNIVGQVAVANGGTGASTLTGYVKGSGTSVMTASSTIPTTDLSGTISNAQLANSAITINGTSTSLGGSISVGTVTSVTGTSPVVSSGGTTPVISMPVATSSVNGYLSSTDWTTFNNKGSGTVTSVSGTTGRITSTGGTTPVIDLASGVATAGTTGSSTLIPVVTIDTYGRVTSITTASNPQGTVTSVTGTAPVVSSGGATPAISMAAANTTTNGYLTSTDWNTFNGKGSGTVTSVALTAPSIFTVTGSPVTSSGTLALTYSGTALPILNGGTGQTTASAAFNALSPMTTAGDIIYGGTSGAGTRLGIGTTGQILTVAGGVPTWSTGGSTNAYTRTSFTATAGQTTFTVSYTVGYVEVYVNGVLLNGADYTATNGTSVVLAVGRATNDIVETIAFATGTVTPTNLSVGTSLVQGGTSGYVLYNNAGVVGNLATTGSGSVVLGTSPTIATPTITSFYGQNSNLVKTPYNGTGLIPAELIYRLESSYTGSASTSAQSFLGVGVTVSGSTVYQFEGLFAVSKTATASSHNFQLGFGGTATINNISYEYYQPVSGITSFNDTSNGAVYTGFIQTATATTIAGPSAATVYKTVFMKGTVSINAGGTFIPQYTTSVSVGPYTTAIGSYFKLSPMSASGSNTSIGTWA